MKNRLSYFKLILIFIIGTFIGSLFNNYYKIPNLNDIKIISDELPIKNGENITLKIVNNEKTVSMSYETWKYLVAKNLIKDTDKRIDAIFARLMDKTTISDNIEHKEFKPTQNKQIIKENPIKNEIKPTCNWENCSIGKT